MKAIKRMIKNNKWKCLISSLLTLLPIAAGLLLWKVLPAQMATHWGVDGEANGWSSRAFAVFGLPLFLLGLHWLCLLITANDRSNRAQHRKVFGLIFWICPATSLYAGTVIYASAFGLALNVERFSLIFIGLLFLLIGNYLPKCRRNSTIGIKLPWTLNNEENWNATHRLGGRVWVGGGALLLLMAFLPTSWLLFLLPPFLLLPVAIPTVYSYVYYKKQLRAGSATKADGRIPGGKGTVIVTVLLLVCLALLLAALLFVCFTGHIEPQYGETALTVEASYWEDLTVSYSDIESIEYREEGVDGARIKGFGSPRLSMGLFRNGEFGDYTRYTYTKITPCVVLTVKGKTLVIGGKDNESAKTIYQELLQRIDGGQTP